MGKLEDKGMSKATNERDKCYFAQLVQLEEQNTVVKCQRVI